MARRVEIVRGETSDGGRLLGLLEAMWKKRGIPGFLDLDLKSGDWMIKVPEDRLKEARKIAAAAGFALSDVKAPPRKAAAGASKATKAPRKLGGRLLEKKGEELVVRRQKVGRRVAA